MLFSSINTTVRSVVAPYSSSPSNNSFATTYLELKISTTLRGREVTHSLGLSNIVVWLFSFFSLLTLGVDSGFGATIGSVSDSDVDSTTLVGVSLSSDKNRSSMSFKIIDTTTKPTYTTTSNAMSLSNSLIRK